MEAADAGEGLVEAVQVAMRGGAVSGFLVVALSLLGVFGIFAAFGGFTNPEEAPFLIVGFGFGASFVALFAQLGGDLGGRVGVVVVEVEGAARVVPVDHHGEAWRTGGHARDESGRPGGAAQHHAHP